MPANLIISKCKGCNNNATTKKGWCSISCYRLNQNIAVEHVIQLVMYYQ